MLRRGATALVQASDDSNDLVAKTVTNVLRQRVLDGAEFTVWGDSPALTVKAYEAKCDTKPFRRTLKDDSDRTVDAGCLRRMAHQLGSA